MKIAATNEFLNECFYYDALTGVLRWKENRPAYHFSCERLRRSNNARWGGKVAGTKHIAHGRKPGCFYVMVWVAGVRQSAHRVAWALAHGLNLDEVPEFIDHRNGDGTDNRLKNLRCATKEQNGWNRSLNSNNMSGYKGVYYRPGENCYIAAITAKGTKHYLGCFTTIKDAAEAYKLAAEQLHGEFARL